MALMDILSAAQGGGLFASVGKAVGLSEGETRAAMAALCPAIAERLRSKSTSDPTTFDDLLDLIDEGGQGESIDDPQALTDADAIADGNAILVEIYGSRDAAIKAMREAAPEVAELCLLKLSAISATAVVGVLATAQGPAALAGGMPAAGNGGILSTIIAALVKGAVQGASRQLAPRRRRRRYSSYFGRRRTTAKRRATRRRARTPSLEDIFGEILGTRRG
jgi:hypothetical protein